MQLTTTAGELLDVIRLASQIVPARPKLRTYTAVLLEVTRGHLLVRGSDGETTVVARLKCSKTSDGQVLPLPAPLERYLAALPAATAVTVTSTSPTQVVIEAADSAPYTFPAYADPYPASVPKLRDRAAVDLSGLAAAVAAVQACAKPLPQGTDKIVQLVSDSSGLRLHATDSVRMARAALPATASFGEFDGLVPLRALTLAASLNPTQVGFDKERSIAFSSDTATVHTRLSRHVFPVVDSVLRRTRPYCVILDRVAVLAALKRLSAVVDKEKAVLMDIAGDQLTITEGDSAAVGSGSETITCPAPATGEIRVAARHEFLRQALETYSTDTVELHWADASSALFLHADEPLEVSHAVMPVRYDVGA